MISTQKNREEKWLPVHGYEEFYAVSSSGLIRRIGKSNCLTQHADSDGYLYVTLCVNGKLKHHKKHTFRRADADI